MRFSLDYQPLFGKWARAPPPRVDQTQESGGSWAYTTFNNETVYRQIPWAGNITKIMTSNWKQFRVTRDMLTAVARRKSVQLKVVWCRWNLCVRFSNFAFVLLYNKSSNLNISNIEFLGKPQGTTLKY